MLWSVAVALGCSPGSGEGLFTTPLDGTGGGAALGVGGGGGVITSSGGNEVTFAEIAPTPEAAAIDDLTGLWTVTTTDISGQQHAMRVALNSTALTVEHWTGYLSAIADEFASTFTVGYVNQPESKDLVALHMGSIAMDLGASPFELSGRWRLGNLVDTGNACEYTLSPTTVEAHCNEVFPPSWIGDLTDRRMNGTKVAVLPSMFGELGGQWQFTFSTGGSCLAHIEHTTLGITCTGITGLEGTTMLTINGDTLSGFTSRGVEFTAYR